MSTSTVLLPTTLDTAPARRRTIPRILVADDDPLTIAQLSSTHTAHRYRVVSASDAQQLHRILKTEVDFNVVILDPAMMDVVSVDIIRDMKMDKRVAHIPIVLVTAKTNSQLVGDCFAAGAAAFVPKPFTSADLERIIRLAVRSGEIQAASLKE